MLCVECRLEDAEPFPSDVTFDTDVVDNQCRSYEVSSSYERYGRDGKRLDSPSDQRAYAVRQILRLGPLNERVRWLDIEATISRRVRVEGRPLTFELVPLETIDLGRYPVPGPATAARYRRVELAGYSLPMYPGGVDLVTSRHRTWATGSYLVPGVRYPCTDILGFYEEWAPKQGWERMRVATSKWDRFTDETRPGKPMVYQLIGRWKQRTSGDELAVICRYELPRNWWGRYTEEDDGKWAQDQAVSLSVRLAAGSAGYGMLRH